MTPTVRIGVVALLLSAAPAWAADFNAEVDFVTRASIADRFAIEESQLALERAGDPRMKSFAQRLVDDHGKAEAALQAAADGSGATVATTLDPDHRARVTALQGKSGADFAKAYVADQSEAHSNALTLYADYMLLGDNEKLHALAIKMIPITETQLNAIRALPGN
jgi:putative membrane protein